MNNSFIYFPSLSSGASKSWLLSNEQLTDTVSSRFYDKNKTPKKFYHPYFLLSAGHNYKKMSLRKDMGLEDSLVIGDSGGYQIATDVLKWTPTLIPDLFNWLEENSDIAINVDIPTRGKYSGQFDTCLKMSIENFEYFEKHQTGKTKFLTVLQGNNIEQYKIWYDAVKHFKFKGWAIGGTGGNISKLIMLISLLLQKGELAKEKNEWIHILGMSGINDFIVIEMLQQLLNKKFNNRIKLSTDSSSPNLATVYGQYYYDINWEKLMFKSLHITRDINSNSKLPCKFKDCPACKNRTFSSFKEWKTKDYMYMTHHNMFLYVDAIKQIQELIDSPFHIIKDILPLEYSRAYTLLMELFDSPTPLDFYFNKISVFDNLSNKSVNNIPDKNKMKQLFNF